MSGIIIATVEVLCSIRDVVEFLRTDASWAFARYRLPAMYRVRNFAPAHFYCQKLHANFRKPIRGGTAGRLVVGTNEETRSTAFASLRAGVTTRFETSWKHCGLFRARFRLYDASR